MKLEIKEPKNKNYAGTIVTLKSFQAIEKRDFIQHTVIYGNDVIVSKDNFVGQRGIFFPVECRLDAKLLHHNNLNRDRKLNQNYDPTDEKQKGGYIEDNRRIKCLKLSGAKSMGLFLPLSSLSYIVPEEELNVLPDGTLFDELNGQKICEKYVIKHLHMQGSGNKKSRTAKVSKLIENQFHFHEDTDALGRNMHRLKPDDWITISDKWHGTSWISSNILCNRKLSWVEKLLLWVNGYLRTRIEIQDTQYENIYSSRKVIKNDDINLNPNHFYGEDIWGDINDVVKQHVEKGMTLYGECVGYTKSGAFIQSGYDYGCEVGTFKVLIYKITVTNPDGRRYVLSSQQAKEWCDNNGLEHVHIFYSGKVRDLKTDKYDYSTLDYTSDDWREKYLEMLRTDYNLEQDCIHCKSSETPVPAEGIVVRKEGLRWEAFKLKAYRFLKLETDMLDKGVQDMESAEAEETEETEELSENDSEVLADNIAPETENSND